MSRESFGFHGVHTISEGGHSPPYNFVISTRFFHNAYKSADTVTRATVKAFKKLPAELLKTSCRYGAMTFDNGKEFADFKELERGPGMRSYFANPYHSWERGTNENTSSVLSEGNEFCACQTGPS